MSSSGVPGQSGGVAARGPSPLLGFLRLCAAVNRALAAVAGVALIASMLILVANVVLRIVAAPLNGTFDLITLVSVAIFGLALGEAQTHQAHVSVDIVVNRFRKGVRLIIGAVVTIASGALFVQLATSLVVYGLNLRAEDAATDTLGIPTWPAVLVVVIGVAGLVLALVADLGRVWLARSSEDPHVNIF